MKKFLLNSKSIVVTFVIALLFLANTALAKTCTWNKIVGGSWTTATNWTGGLPVAGDNIIIPADQSADYNKRAGTYF